MEKLSFGDLNVKTITAIVNPLLIQNFAGQYAVQQSRLGTDSSSSSFFSSVVANNLGR